MSLPIISRCVAPLSYRGERCPQMSLGKMRFCVQHMFYTKRYKHYKHGHNYYTYICLEMPSPPSNLETLPESILNRHHANLFKRYNALRNMLTLRLRYQDECIHQSCWDKGHVLLHRILEADSEQIDDDLTRVSQELANRTVLNDQGEECVPKTLYIKQRSRAQTV